MTENNETRRKYPEGLFTAISVGFFLLLVGGILLITPSFFDNVVDFFKDFGLVDVPHTNLIFFGPETPEAHLALYQAAGQISIAVAMFQVLILMLRFIVPSSWGKRSETVGNLVYWVGAAFLTQTFLIESTQWFPFWSATIIVVGVSMIIRASVTAASQS